MLALSRRKQESVVINSYGTLIEVKVAQVRPDGKVTLCFDAPREVEIQRKEIWERKQKEKVSA